MSSEKDLGMAALPMHTLISVLSESDREELVSLGCAISSVVFAWMLDDRSHFELIHQVLHELAPTHFTKLLREKIERGEDLGGLPEDIAEIMLATMGYHGHQAEGSKPKADVSPEIRSEIEDILDNVINSMGRSKGNG